MGKTMWVESSFTKSPYFRVSVTHEWTITEQDEEIFELQMSDNHQEVVVRLTKSQLESVRKEIKWGKRQRRFDVLADRTKKLLFGRKLYV
jgi:hypothetical protein